MLLLHNQHFSADPQVELRLGDLDVSHFPFRLPPNAPDLLNEDGSLNWLDWAEVGLDNPLRGYYNNSEVQSSSLVTNLGLSFAFTRNLRISTSLGYTNYNSEELLKRPSRSYNPLYQQLPSSSSHLFTERKSWIMEPQLSYNPEFGNAKIKIAPLVKL